MEYEIHQREPIDTLYIQDSQDLIRTHWKANPSTEGKLNFRISDGPLRIVFSDNNEKENPVALTIEMVGTYDAIITGEYPNP